MMQYRMERELVESFIRLFHMKFQKRMLFIFIASIYYRMESDKEVLKLRNTYLKVHITNKCIVAKIN